MNDTRAPDDDNRRNGPRRSEASTRAVRDAAIAELVENGWRGFSVDRVAKRAKASKQTIYRWWNGPALLVVEAALLSLPDAEPEPSDPLEAVTALIRPLIAAMRTGDGSHVWRGVLLAASDDEAASEAFHAWIQDAMKKPLRHILAREAALGKIRRDWDIDFALETLIGPLWHRVMAMRAPVPERYAERLAEALLTNLRSTAAS